MRRTTRTLGALALSAGLAVGLAACTDEPDTETPDPSAVTAAIAKLDETTHQLSLTVGSLMSGQMSVDPVKESYLGSVTVDPLLAVAQEGEEQVRTEFIVIGADQWWRTGGSADAGWVHTQDGEDFAKSAGLNLPQLRDELLASLDKVTGVSPNTFTATVDPTKLTALGSGDPVKLAIALDDQGQLVSITGDIPDTAPEAAEGAVIPVTLSFAGYGEPVEVAAPADSEITEE